MIDSLPDIFSSLANSIPVQQARLDRSFLNDLHAAADLIRSARACGWGCMASEILPARWLASETEIQLELATAISTETELSAAIVNTAHSRRYPKQSTGSQKISMKVRCSTYRPGTDVFANSKEGHNS